MGHVDGARAEDRHEEFSNILQYKSRVMKSERFNECLLCGLCGAPIRVRLLTTYRAQWPLQLQANRR